MFSRLRAEETMLFRVGCISLIEHAQTFVFNKTFIGLYSNEKLFPARLGAQEKFWETLFSQQCFLVCEGLFKPIGTCPCSPALSARYGQLHLFAEV